MFPSDLFEKSLFTSSFNLSWSKFIERFAYVNPYTSMLNQKDHKQAENSLK